jgi:CDP-diacylglycerol--inositol 3-phosphatidyltransferase
MTKQPRIVTENDVLLFVPNLIGYGRVACALASFLIMICLPEYWILAVALYLANFIGDLFDGFFARKLNQCSTYGGVLDMVTDRCGTLGLFLVLSAEYMDVDATLSFPIFRPAFLVLAILDISSHWVQAYSALTTGHHHKSEEGNKGRNILVRWFYEYYYFFGYLCVGAEFTYVLMYCRKHLDDETGWTPSEFLRTALDIFLCVCIPGCLAKQVVNVAQLTSGFSAIARYDADQINSKAN